MTDSHRLNIQRAALLMHPNGAGSGQWLLKTPDITLYLSGGKWNGVASVRFNAQYLWSCHNSLEAITSVHTLETVRTSGPRHIVAQQAS